MKPAEFHFARRGWILGALFLALAWARWLSPQPLQPWGLALIAAGAAYRFYAGRFIPGHSNSRRLAGSSLAFSGPYRFGRHPLYLSNLAVIAGLIVFAHCLPLWGAVSLFSIACAHHELLARMEEAYLSAAWGEAYLGYLRVTPRWLGIPSAGAGRTGPAGGVSGRPASAAAPPPADIALSWARQGANLGKSAFCAAILWAIANAHR